MPARRRQFRACLGTLAFCTFRFWLFAAELQPAGVNETLPSVQLSYGSARGCANCLTERGHIARLSSRQPAKRAGCPRAAGSFVHAAGALPLPRVRLSCASTWGCANCLTERGHIARLSSRQPAKRAGCPRAAGSFVHAAGALPLPRVRLSCASTWGCANCLTERGHIARLSSRQPAKRAGCPRAAGSFVHAAGALPLPRVRLSCASTWGCANCLTERGHIARLSDGQPAKRAGCPRAAGSFARTRGRLPLPRVQLSYASTWDALIA
ncbi:MAG: hypothetical protein BWX68_02143 [Verrucomicrobia bacterium ADurb.Bin063]|nr:MAG: hypothetical protein BWX68_02143 [Verrucomicrobia bacterium ADurb.Bin063]